MLVRRILWGVVLVVLMPGLANALGLFGDERPEYGDYVESEPWKEAFTKIPDYPTDERLIELEIDKINTPFTYWIDPDSIAPGEDDVVRYMILLRSSTGSENAFYEGIRCETNEYKTYAYGVNKRFKEKRRVYWQTISNKGSVRYRAELQNYYLCQNAMPLDKDSILQNIKYPKSNGRYDNSFL